MVSGSVCRPEIKRRILLICRKTARASLELAESKYKANLLTIIIHGGYVANVSSTLVFAMARLSTTISKKRLDERAGGFTGFCRQVGLPITPQRLTIYRILAGAKTHPDAKAIHSKVVEKFPHVSLATVYKNLDILEDVRIIRKVAVVNRKARYDAELKDHHHLIDEDSGKIVDLFAEELNKLELPTKIKERFALQRASINFYVRKR